MFGCSTVVSSVCACVCALVLRTHRIKNTISNKLLPICKTFESMPQLRVHCQDSNMNETAIEIEWCVCLMYLDIFEIGPNHESADKQTEYAQTHTHTWYVWGADHNHDLQQ